MKYLPGSSLILVIAACSVFVVVSGRYCTYNNSDSVLHPIMSVTHVTPYYWGQNRLGNVFPFVTSWITDIKINYAVQLWLRAAVACALPLLLILLIRPRLYVAVTFGVSLAVLLASFRDKYIEFLFLDGGPYATAAAFLTAAVVIADRVSERVIAPRDLALWFCTFVMLLLSLFSNLSFAVFCAVLFAALALLFWSKRRAVMTMLVFAAYLLVSWHASTIEGGRDYMTFQWSVEHTRAGWLRTFEAVAHPYPILIATVFAVGVLLWSRQGEILARALAVTFAAAAAITITTNAEWPILNGLHLRYFSLYAALLLITATILVIDAAGRFAVLTRTVGYAALALAFSTSAVLARTSDQKCSRYWPAGVDGSIDTVKPAAAQFDVTLVGGDYWKAWVLVYELLAEGKQAYGVALRGSSIRDYMQRKAKAARKPGLICFGESAKCIDDYVGNFQSFLPRHELESLLVPLQSGVLANGEPYSVYRLM
jgi:hypothetical protein